MMIDILWADSRFAIDAVYLWLAMVAGALFTGFLLVRWRSALRPRMLFEMGMAVFVCFSLLGFFNRILSNPDDGWPSLWQFSLRWFFFVGTVVALSAIITAWERRHEDC